MCVYVSEKERERERARAVPGPEALVTQSYLCERVCVRVSAWEREQRADIIRAPCTWAQISQKSALYIVNGGAIWLLRNFYPQRPSTESAPVYTKANFSTVSAVYCKLISQLMFGKCLPAESVYRISVYARGNFSKVSFKVIFCNKMRRKMTSEISTRRGLFTESALMLLETSQKLVQKSFSIVN